MNVSQSWSTDLTDSTDSTDSMEFDAGLMMVLGVYALTIVDVYRLILTSNAMRRNIVKFYGNELSARKKDFDAMVNAFIEILWDPKNATSHLLIFIDDDNLVDVCRYRSVLDGKMFFKIRKRTRRPNIGVYDTASKQWRSGEGFTWKVVETEMNWTAMNPADLNTKIKRCLLKTKPIQSVYEFWGCWEQMMTDKNMTRYTMFARDFSELIELAYAPVLHRIK